MSSNPPAEAARVDTRRWWARSGSLRNRLLIGQVVLLALVCTGIGLGAGLALRGYLLHQLDAQVREVSQRSALLSGLPPPRPDMLRELGQQPGPGPAFLDAPGQPIGAVAAVIDTTAEPPRLLSAGTLNRIGERSELSAAAQAQLLKFGLGADVPRIPPGPPTDPAEPPARAEPERRPVTVELDGVGDHRMIAEYDRLGRLTVTGLPTAELDATMLRVLWIFLVLSAVALLIASILSVLITRRALAPLTRAAATARRVAGLPLDRGEVALPVRIPERDADPNTEVGQLGSALNRMLDHIATALSTRQASETRVRKFVADASHELRTPLAAIRGYTELAQRRGDDLPPEVAHALGRVTSESDRMTHLVEDLLLLARLDSGRPLQREPVDLSALAVDAVSDAHIAGPDHIWKLELPAEPVLVTGDGPRLQQVLGNLLANAGTHTPAGTTVTVSLAQERDSAVLRVTDDGPGIPAELQPEVFERFARGDSSRSRRSGGTGLGLAIVSAVLRAHRGSIVLHSTPGATEFTVRLPFTADA